MENLNNLNIVLVGMPGAGKSFIGEKLAKLLAQFTYIDTDSLIEKNTGMTISEIFEKKSEKQFRAIESDLIKQLAENKNCIISLGGGAFENDENIKLLKRNGLIFYLQTPIEELLSRIEHETHRPLINNNVNPKQKLKSLLKKRKKNFLKANFVINTYKQPAYILLDKIIGEYEKYVR